MSLNVGDCLGHYNVTAQIGQGGMGQVYRVRDTKLDSDVPLKVLPDDALAAGGRIYIPSLDGTTLVIVAGPIFEVLAANMLEDGFGALPAVADGGIYRRGQRYLYCIAAD